MPDAIGDEPGEATAGVASDAPEGIASEVIESMLEPSFSALFHAFATIRGAHWELREFEKTALVKGWTPVIQHLLNKLGDQEQVMMVLAIGATAAVVGGKLAQDVTRRASSTASTRMPASGASAASSASGAAARQPAPNGSFEEQDGL